MGYESWSPEGSRKKGKVITYSMPALCPGLVLSHLILTKTKNRTQGTKDYYSSGITDKLTFGGVK